MSTESVIERRRRALGGALVTATAMATLALTPSPAHAASACTTLYPPGGGSTAVCKTWDATGGGYYKGTWRIGVTTSYTYVQLYKDGAVSNASGTSGSYTQVKKFLMRACNALPGGGCGPWW